MNSIVCSVSDLVIKPRYMDGSDDYQVGYYVPVVKAEFVTYSEGAGMSMRMDFIPIKSGMTLIEAMALKKELK